MRERPKAGQLIPPPELAPPAPTHLSQEQRIKVWMDLMDDAESILLAGLRNKIGPHGDLRAAYREWYTEHMKDHDRAMLRMMTEFYRRTHRDGG